MVSTYEDVIGAALALPPGARAMLAEHLLESLDLPDQKEVDGSWAVEVERRMKDMDEGKAELFEGQQVLRELRNRAKR